MTKEEMLAQIQTIENRLTAQLESISGMRGIHEDVIRMLVPAMKDQLNLLRGIVALIKE